MLARIYRPARSATQSGQARSREWVLEFAPESRREPDPLMGWTSTEDTVSQVRIHFETREAAEAWAKEHEIPYVVLKPHERRPNIRPRGYAENFAADRRIPWTH